MEQLADTKTEFLIELDDLYAEVEDWVKSRGLETTRGWKLIREEEFGTYEAPSLEIRSDEHVLAKLDPVGASIVGADGRVDLKGRVTSEIISLFEKPRPSIAIPGVFNDDATQQQMRPFYPEVTEPGWYWIEGRTRGQAIKVTCDLFFNRLLKRVSNYGTRE
jgi:hypothetical protein